jgi:hypothetical protein
MASLGVFFAFALSSLQGPEIVIPNGGETFDKRLQDNEDALRSGADWGVSQPGRLRPGIGGGSGRLGDLFVGAGEVVTLRTGPVPAEGHVAFVRAPDSGDGLRLNGFFLNFFDGGFGTIEVDKPYTSLTLSYLTSFLEAQQANAALNVASYRLESFSTERALLRVLHKVPGSAGNAYTLEFIPADPGNPTGMASGRTLAGGADDERFQAGNLLDNFDFQANPGGTPFDIHVADGVFEFATIHVAPNGVLRCVGPNPARIFARGEAAIEGLVDVSGSSPGQHPSGSPHGQPSTLARGGPNAGAGGEGAHRPNNALPGNPKTLVPPNSVMGPGPTTIPLSEGIVTFDPLPAGKAGAGVGVVAGQGAGQGGARWPDVLPVSQIDFG